MSHFLDRMLKIMIKNQLYGTLEPNKPPFPPWCPLLAFVPPQCLLSHCRTMCAQCAVVVPLAVCCWACCFGAGCAALVLVALVVLLWPLVYYFGVAVVVFVWALLAPFIFHSITTTIFNTTCHPTLAGRCGRQVGTPTLLWQVWNNSYWARPRPLSSPIPIPHTLGESLHCALLLDYVPPEEPPGTPLGNTLRIR